MPRRCCQSCGGTPFWRMRRPPSRGICEAESIPCLSDPLLRDLMWLTSALNLELRLEERLGETELESLPAYQLLREIWEVALAEGSASTPEEILERLEDSREERLLRAKITDLT